MFGWILVIIAVLAILNAEKLPALRQMAEEKFKDGIDAAKVGSKLAKDKIQQVKTDMENKKAEANVVEAEENTPEEIAESMEFMGSFVEDAEKKKTAKKQTKKD